MTGGALAGQPLEEILRERFGFEGFRPHQEDVCRAVADGADALLVMPTGSGKSLCYQLPGLARGGTTLVISPLIALMEDQTAKLQALGLRAERIHSGRSREESRAVCRAYLDGTLDFLAIAPERLSVPGFPEMLARRKPALIAVDEAHCISHWGHDFRPDYRLLNDRLPLLRPAPVLALTATATVRVQDDILDQLGIKTARRFIHGFRRDNLAIEAIARSRSGRLDDVIAALEAPDRLPAIVYVPTRKQADQVAEELGRQHRCGAYHAGLDAHQRARTQERFLAGELDVIVATIAFGMGIDKADIRTVIHMALPGTLEGYYQEIGRAGRDGKPSRALLLYSYGDRKIHESFLNRDYPEPEVLAGLLQSVPAAGIDRAALGEASGLPPDHFEPAIEKLWIHGGVTVDAEDVVRRGKPTWRASYESIRRYRVQQLDDILDFAQSNGCRMVRLVRYFGETRDTRPCGLCDACKPKGCVGRRFRPPTLRERAQAERVIDELERRDGLATGTLYRSLFEGKLERRDFEAMLDAMERAGAVSLEEDAFEKEGKTLRFRRVKLKRAARSTVRGDTFLLDADSPAPPPAAARPSVTIRKRASSPDKATKTKASRPSPAVAVDSTLFEALRAWRREAARARNIPAFRILTDQVLTAIAVEQPASLGELHRVRGMGPKLVEKYGADILAILERTVSR
ncbi:MAG: RecQ family ATP-dependent DNA helicase [Myxococcales bacterium]